jgi:hypothetical protein
MHMRSGTSGEDSTDFSSKQRDDRDPRRIAWAQRFG